MRVSAELIHQLVADELSTVDDARVTTHVRELLVEPKVVNRLWHYGEPGQKYECWSVLNEKSCNIGIAYSVFGFGPKNPWGLVSIAGTEDDMSIGMDCGWFPRFIDAYFESAASDLHIWRVFKQGNEPYPGMPITEESDWDTTWEQVNQFRDSDSSARYNHHHSVRYSR